MPGVSLEFGNTDFIQSKYTHCTSINTTKIRSKFVNALTLEMGKSESKDEEQHDRTEIRVTSRSLERARVQYVQVGERAAPGAAAVAAFATFAAVAEEARTCFFVVF